MDSTVFKKMKLKPGTSGIYLYAPREYIEMANNQEFIDFSANKTYDFVHLFVESRQEYSERIGKAIELLSETGMLWISYPKSSGKNKYDINRDVLFTLLPEQGFTACASAALDDKWSAMRFKRI